MLAAASSAYFLQDTPEVEAAKRQFASAYNAAARAASYASPEQPVAGYIGNDPTYQVYFIILQKISKDEKLKFYVKYKIITSRTLFSLLKNGNELHLALCSEHFMFTQSI